MHTAADPAQGHLHVRVQCLAPADRGIRLAPDLQVRSVGVCAERREMEIREPGER